MGSLCRICLYGSIAIYADITYTQIKQVVKEGYVPAAQKIYGLLYQYHLLCIVHICVPKP